SGGPQGRSGRHPLRPGARRATEPPGGGGQRSPGAGVRGDPARVLSPAKEAGLNWRGGRAAEGARLESVYTETYRGFESHPLRQRRVRRSAPEVSICACDFAVEV